MRRAVALLVLGVFGVVVAAGAAVASPGPGGPAGGKPVVGSVISHVIVHETHKGREHGGPPGGGGDGEPVDHSGHYLLLPGAWAGEDPTVTYVVEDPSIPGALQAVQSGFAAWNGVSGITFVFGGPQDVSPNAEAGGPSGANTVSWALLTGSWTNALAVTLLWIDDSDGDGGWDAGEPIVENDLFFNAKYKWAVDPDGEGPQRPEVKGKWYDVQNVATHEAGHFVGLDDQTQWDDETMYASAGSGEVKKRSLEPGDIAGAQFLYGP